MHATIGDGRNDSGHLLVCMSIDLACLAGTVNLRLLGLTRALVFMRALAHARAAAFVEPQLAYNGVIAQVAWIHAAVHELLNPVRIGADVSAAASGA